MPVTKIMLCGGPAHNMKTKIPLSNGDNAGVAGGVKSNRFMGQTEFKKGCGNVKFKGKPATKMLMPTDMNNGNMVGATIAPSQTKVMGMK